MVDYPMFPEVPENAINNFSKDLSKDLIISDQHLYLDDLPRTND